MVNNMKILLFFGAFFLVFSSCLAKIVPYTDCGSNATIVSCEVLPCEVDFNDGCSLKRGENVTFKITYNPNFNCTKVFHEVHGQLNAFPVKIRFNRIRGNACDNHSPKCPLYPGRQVTYEAVVPILTGYPTGNISVWYDLKCGQNALVGVKIPTRIINSDGTIPTPRTTNRSRGRGSRG